MATWPSLARGALELRRGEDEARVLVPRIGIRTWSDQRRIVCTYLYFSHPIVDPSLNEPPLKGPFPQLEGTLQPKRAQPRRKRFGSLRHATLVLVVRRVVLVVLLVEATILGRGKWNERETGQQHAKEKKNKRKEKNTHYQDDVQVLVVREESDVLEGVPVHEEEVGVVARSNLAELVRVKEKLAAEGGGGDDGLHGSVAELGDEEFGVAVCSEGGRGRSVLDRRGGRRGAYPWGVQAKLRRVPTRVKSQQL